MTRHASVDHARALVLNDLRAHPKSTVAEVQARTELTESTVWRAFNELSREYLIVKPPYERGWQVRDA